MKRCVVALSLLSVLIGCSPKQSAEPSVDKSATLAPMDDSDCNLKTPLVPGIPGSPGNLIPSKINPNGHSELAYLMRQFLTDLEGARARIEKGEAVEKLFPKHRKMRCAWPSAMSERNEAYDRRCKAYLNEVRKFDQAPSKATYNAIISSCVACHSVSCQGPIPMISRYVWE